MHMVEKVRAKRRVTSADVAAASGVSRATVSYVLNGVAGQSISEATKIRVVEAAKSLGYVRSAVGVALRRGRSELVLLDTSGLPRGFNVGEYTRSFAEVLRGAGAVVLEHTSAGARGELEAVVSAASPFAVVSSKPVSKLEEARLRAAGVELISGIDFGKNRDLRKPLATSAGRLQAELLFSRGRSLLSYMTSSSSHQSDSAKYRIEGFRARCLELGLRDPEIVEGSSEIERMVVDLRKLIDSGVKGIATFDDELAFAVLAAFDRMGVSVPDQVAVMGVDDIPLAKYAIPALTTLKLDTKAMGVGLATELLRAMGREVSLQSPEEVSYQLVQRSTT